MEERLAAEILDEVRESHSPTGWRRQSLLKLAGAAALGAPAFTGLLQVSMAHPAAAATNTYVVNVLGDPNPSDTTTGACATGGSCTLRQAVNQFNADPTGDTDTITFSVRGTFGLGAKLKIDNSNSDSLTITGNGPTETVISVGTFGIGAKSDLLMSGVEITGATGTTHGLTNFGAAVGLVDSIVTGNADTGSASGAGIDNGIGSFTATNDTFSSNSVSSGTGGAIYNDDIMTLVNDTFSGNTASSNGGAIYNADTMTVTNVTFSDNSATSGGAIYNADTATVRNSIFAGQSGASDNAPNNCAGSVAITDGGYNVEGDSSGSGANTCGFGGTSLVNQTDNAIGLGTLANNGGQTPTEALNSSSVAASLAQSNCPPTDQRGVARPATGCSSGAYQIGQIGVSPPPNSPTGLTATNQGNTIVVNWNSSSGANCYDLYRYTQGTVATLIATVCPSGSGSSSRTANARSAQTASPSDPSYTDTNVSCGVAYSYYVTATNSIGPSGPSNTASASVPCGTGTTASQGYWLAGSDGGIFSFGNVSYHGSVPGDGIHVNNVVGMAPTHDSGGYWLAGSDGGVFTFGDATYHGSVPGDGIHINNVRGIAPTADGGGYYMVGTDGGVFTFGDALYHGSVPGLGIHVSNIIGILPTPDGGGYWIVGSDGGVFTFGDATYHGSVPGDGIHVNNVVGLAPTSDGAGYWMTGTDGGVFTFGDATYHGSVPGDGIHVSNVRGIFATADGAGYWLFGTDGGIFTFGDATYEGSVPGDGIHVSNVLAGAT